MGIRLERQPRLRADTEKQLSTKKLILPGPVEVCEAGMRKSGWDDERESVLLRPYVLLAFDPELLRTSRHDMKQTRVAHAEAHGSNVFKSAAKTTT